LGVLPKYFEGDAATIDTIAEGWNFYIELFALPEYQP
jgi:hypothetical protein